jgi:outer membrane autotransporter protein
MDGMNLAAYAAFTSGNFFVNGLAKVDWANVESSPGPGVAVEFDATAWGVRGTAGFRFDLGGHFYAEPSVSLSWVNVDIDNYTAAGATVVFDDITSFRGAAGVRIGADIPAGNGTWTPFVGLHAIEEFDGDVRNNFTLGTTIGILQDAPGTFGEASAGINYTTGRLEGFIRGELDFGGETEGVSGRAGLRLRF